MKRGFDPRRDEWSQACLPIAFSEIWKPIMGASDYRKMVGSERMRDLDYGIDVELLRPGRPPIMMAARFREPGAIKYGDITIRHRSLQTPGKVLETAKAVARYMTYAWADSSYKDFPKEQPSRFLDWVVIRLPALLDAYHDGRLKPKVEPENIDQSSTFLAFDLHEICGQNLIAYKKVNEE